MFGGAFSPAGGFWPPLRLFTCDDPAVRLGGARAVQVVRIVDIGSYCHECNDRSCCGHIRLRGSPVSSINSANTAFLTQSERSSAARPILSRTSRAAASGPAASAVTTLTTETAGNVNFGGPATGSLMCETRTQEELVGHPNRRRLCRTQCRWLEPARRFNNRLSGREDARGHPARPQSASELRDSFRVPFVDLCGGFLVDGQIRGYSRQI
jgi:hypothetical protein